MTIDLAAIRKNIAPLGPIIPMIKGNGHGTSMVELGRFFENEPCPFLGVSHLSEAIELRDAGITKNILLLSFLPCDAEIVIHYNITPVVDTLDKVIAIEHVKKSHPMHLHIETGMNRFGCSRDEAPLLAHRISNLDGIMTHFSTPEDRVFTQKQIDTFAPFANRAAWTHAASSNILGNYDLSFCNLSRIGLRLFYPNPVITLHAKLLSVKTVKQGESVGYGRHYIAQKAKERVGVISIGYHDGWHLAYSEKGTVWLHGKFAPMIGKICMDFQMIDLTDIPEARVGDDIELIGPHLPLDHVAKTFEMNPRHLLASLGNRIERRFIREHAIQRAI